MANRWRDNAMSLSRLPTRSSSGGGIFARNGSWLGAMARANRPESERRDFHLFIDEFQNFSTDAFASILAHMVMMTARSSMVMFSRLASK